MAKMEKQIKQFLDFLQNEKRVSNNTLQSYSRDIHQFESYLSQNRINYNKVDNTKIQEITESGGMKYEYTLTAYNKNGKEKEIKFKTSRELREDAYLELEVMQIRGVVNWKEVQESELPEDVKTAMNVE